MAEHPSNERPLVFDCGGEPLVGIVHRCAGGAARDVGVVVVVGGPQYRVGSHRQFVLMARALAAAGFSVLRFDYRGMGDSGGKIRTFESVDTDIRAAVDALLAASPNLRGVVLWGLCDAASAVLMYCSEDPRVLGVALANPWVRTQAGEAKTYLRHYYVRRVLELSFWRKLLTGGFRFGKAATEFTAAVRHASSAGGESSGFVDRMLSSLQRFDGPVRLLLSECDLTAQEFADHCRDDREWQHAMKRGGVDVTTLAEADHTFSTRKALADAVVATLALLDDVLAAARR